MRGICQLMEGLIFDIKITMYSDPGESEDWLQSHLSSAIESLDDFLEKGYSFIAKYRERGILTAAEEERCRRIVDEKYDVVLEILKREYAALVTMEDE